MTTGRVASGSVRPAWSSIVRRHLLSAAIVLVLFPLGWETAQQIREDAFLHETALRIVADAHATTPRERVLALRDYVRSHVSHFGAPGPDDARPFLRAPASDTLRSGLGFCGEDSRLFVDLARSIGIEAQRLNLYGATPHVVAEVELVPHERLVVDAQSPPMIADLEPLDQVMLRPEFDDYYSVNLRRLHLGFLVSRIRLEMGPLTYWLENPHALGAALWAALLAALVVLRMIRPTIRYLLVRRGWVHRSALEMPPDADVATR